MPFRFALFIATVLIVPNCASRNLEKIRPLSGQNGVVVASHEAASQIGLRVLQTGGNAVDAAVAAGLAMGIVDQFNSGIGGGGFVLIRLADGTVYAIDGREKAPRAATRDMYLREGEFQPQMSRRGPLAVAIPGLLAAYEKALELSGTRSLEELVALSLGLAEQGFPLNSYYLGRYRQAVGVLRQDPASAGIYFRPDGTALEEGDLLIQPCLADTYRKLTQGGTHYFYQGEFAQRLASYMEERGGLITLEDMQEYEAVVREPIVGKYRGYSFYGTPPPSSGGIHVLQILNMLEASGILEGEKRWSQETILWTSRFMARAFQDRAAHLGDSDFYPVPRERLTSKAYAEEIVEQMMQKPEGGSLRNLIHPPPGLAASPRDMVAAINQGHTANIVVVDRWMNAVSINQTVNLTYGAKITLPGTGVILNDEMDDFSACPGVPNAFGLIGSEANAIEPGKRPLSSMAPTIVAKDGRPVLILGGAGGPTIITAVLLMIVNALDFDMELAEALARPRFHHQFRPQALMMERSTPRSSRLSQQWRGQTIHLRDHIGVTNTVAWSPAMNAYVGGADPRGGGQAAAY